MAPLAKNGGPQKKAWTTVAIAALLVMGFLAAVAFGGTSGGATSSGSTETAFSSGPASTISTLSLLSLNPTIESDQADYNPGATVHLTGHNWDPGEAVHIFVNDDIGQTWSYSNDVTADANGDFVLSFVLPTAFVATYSVTATGAISGTARTSFTDGNVKFDVAPTGNTATFVEHIFPNSTNCTGTEQTNGGFPK